MNSDKDIHMALLDAAKRGTLDKLPKEWVTFRNLKRRSTKEGFRGAYYSPIEIAAKNGSLDQIPDNVLCMFHGKTLNKLHKLNEAMKQNKIAVAEKGDVPF